MNSLELSSLADDELKSLDLNSKTFGVIGVCGVVGNLLARILMDRGYDVIGTDMSSKEDCRFKDSFEDYDIDIFYGNHPDEFFKRADFIIPPPSLPKTAKIFEIIKEKEIPILELGDIFKLFNPDKPVICITGTNGKTTTTTLLKHIANFNGLKLSEHNLANMQGNNEFIPSLQSRLNGDLAILETGTDGTPGGLESIISLTNASCGILTNITPDHLDEHENILEYAKVKGEFVKGLNGKTLIINSDDPTVVGLIREMNFEGNLISFGLDAQIAKIGTKPCWCGKDIKINEIIAGVGRYSCNCGIEYKKPDYLAKDISLKDKTFTVIGPNGVNDKFRFNMNLDGLHNVYNALGTIVVAHEFLDMSYEDIQSGLANFSGVPGRMEIMGKSNGKTVMVDYAHNPAGVETVLRELQKIYGDFTVVITVSSESGHNGDLEILSHALNYVKYIVPASYSSRIAVDEVLANLKENGFDENLSSYGIDLDYGNLKERFILTDVSPENFKKNTLGANEAEVIEGLKTAFKSDSNLIVCIGEAAFKFNHAIANYLK